MQRLILLFALVTIISPLTHSAPDKIGNGGGVWMCELPTGDFTDLMFVDVFEARREFKLNLPEITTEPLVSLHKRKQWIKKNLPSHSEMIDDIEYVEKSITWIEDVLVTIPDVSNKTMPHPSTCRGGKWTLAQMVNFTEDFRILVRKDFYNSSFLTDLEREAVYLHEGVYSYLRTTQGDVNSVRTRQIVGLLLADGSYVDSPEKIIPLSDAERAKRIEKILGQSQPTPPPPPPSGKIICGLRPDDHSALYAVIAKTEAEARASVVKACKDGENPFPDEGRGGFPFPMFPGFPGGEETPGLGMKCRENKVYCEVLEAEYTRKCTIIDFWDKVIAEDVGRSLIEAQERTMRRCLTSGSEHECYASRNMTCR